MARTAKGTPSEQAIGAWPRAPVRRLVVGVDPRGQDPDAESPLQSSAAACFRVQGVAAGPALAQDPERCMIV
eukprot:4489979-Alexandrium_andersonii.AAC.1